MSLEANKAIIRQAVDEVINQKVLGAIDELFAPDYVDHSSMAGEDQGREGFKQFAQVLFDAFPDFQVTIEDMLAEGDKVMYRGTVSGTHTGEFMGAHPSGKRFEVTEMHVDRIAEGKIVEHWGLLDIMGMLQQIGIIHEPEEVEG